MNLEFGAINLEVRDSDSDRLCIKELWDGVDTYEIGGLDPGVIVDIGANIGTFTVLAAHLYPDAEIRAFEPEPWNYSLLVDNIFANHMLDRVHMFNLAVTNTFLGVDLHPEHGLSHVCPPGHDHNKIRCMSVTLDAALAGLERVDILKVDCEGSEYEIFAAASDETMRKIVRLRMEIHDYRSSAELEALRATLSRWFTLREIGFVPGHGGLWFGECSQSR